MEIHILLAGVQIGPFSEKQVREYLVDGLVSPTDLAKHDGMREWEAVNLVLAHLPLPELVPEPEPAAVTPPPQSVAAAPNPAPASAPAPKQPAFPPPPLRRPGANPDPSSCSRFFRWWRRPSGKTQRHPSRNNATPLPRAAAPVSRPPPLPPLPQAAPIPAPACRHRPRPKPRPRKPSPLRAFCRC
jgi:hypothetical protein